MTDNTKATENLFAELCLDPGFVLVPQDRYEELIRAEVERDVMEATVVGENRYQIDTVVTAIKTARKALYLPRCKAETEEAETDDAE